MIRSSAVRALCGSAMLAILAGVASAQVPEASSDREWIERSRRILEQAAESAPPPWLRSLPGQSELEAANTVLDQSHSGSLPAANVARRRLLIFGSLAIPRVTLESLLEQAAQTDVVFVLRGLPRGSSLRGLVRQLSDLAPDHERVPHVIVDPTLFQRYGVERAPTFVFERGDAGPPIIAIGAVNVAWMRRIEPNVPKGGERLGNRAESYAIAEPDLIREMQARVAGIDWEAKRHAALASFWSRHADAFVDLPEAKQAREFLVDPTVRVVQDLEDAEGRVLVAAGETFNPLRWVPLSKTVIVFRGTDAGHVAAAQELARAARQQGRGVILLTTQLERARAWEHLSELEDELGATVYVLPAELIGRFHLENIPAAIAPRGLQLLVQERPPQAAP